MLIKYVGGQCRISFPAYEKRRVFALFAREDVQFCNTELLDHTVRVLIPYYRKKAVLSLLQREGIDAECIEILGLPSLIKRYRKRIGIPIGLLLAFVLIWLSGRVIWCINIKGNENVSDKEIIEELEKLGCGIGDTYGDIDFDILHNRFLMECKDISWIAVNMNGTHANVEVRETVRGEESEEGGFFNIVAAENGQIEMIAEKAGKPVVERFDTVLEGELLISGAISYRQDTLSRYESADGSVFARVNRSFSVKVPLNQEIKSETGEKTEKKTIRFFNFDINLFRNSRIPYKLCDKITMNSQVYLFDSLPLPLYINKTVHTEYVMKKVRLSESEARDKAKKIYREKLYEVLGDSTLISKSVSENLCDDCYVISCELYCLADIAKKVPLEISENDENIKEETEKDGTENS